MFSTLVHKGLIVAIHVFRPRLSESHSGIFANKYKQQNSNEDKDFGSDLRLACYCMTVYAVQFLNNKKATRSFDPDSYQVPDSLRPNGLLKF